ncbi:AraC family transcriptional regulator [Novosphingobium terrae]|uniref:AraC family transcriptional regulator n=1 Tax=Novosphingobium terrae TaxID=2726189 RepID=UPI00197DE018|nr:AraC family transcriptional regulator [Novosphingobium terrae]
MRDYDIKQDKSPKQVESVLIAGSRSDVPVPSYVLYGDAEPRPKWFINVEPLERRCRERGWVIQPHVHPRFCQLMLVTGGHGEMLIEGESQPFSCGSVLVVPPHRIHGFRYEGSAQGWVLTIDTHYFESLLQRAPALHLLMMKPGVVDLPPAVLDQLTPDLERLGQELEGGRRGSSIGADIHLMAVLLHLFRHWPDGTAPAPSGHGRGRLVARFRALVEEQFRRQPLLDAMAAQLGVSVSQLRLACTQVAGLSPQAMLHERILAEAQRYLAYTALSVTGIAGELGFAEASYFTRFFKKKTGETPRAWRLAHAERSGFQSADQA